MAAPPTALVVVLALAAGATAGVGLERAGVLSPLEEPVAAAVRADRVPALDCPEGNPVATLVRGDRVLVTARSADGSWIEIRSPVDLGEDAWLAASSVGADAGAGDVADLPVHGCSRPEAPRPSTTTTSSTTTTTTTAASTTSTETTAPPDEVPTTVTTPRPTTTATTVVLDQTPPTISPITRSQAAIVEGIPNCPGQPNAPTSSVLTMTATDDRAGVRVDVTFSATGGPNGTVAVPPPNGSVFSGVFGPFAENTIPAGTIRLVTIFARAIDAAGNSSPTVTTTVEIRRCS